MGVVLGAALGTAGGYLTARQQGRQALELAKAAAAKEQERQLRQLAVDIAKIELERDRSNPHMAAEHVAVLMQLLKRLDIQLDSKDTAAGAVEQFRKSYCEMCGASTVASSGICSHCGL